MCGFIALSKIQAFVSFRVLIIFLMKLAFLLFFSDMVTRALGFLIAMIKPGRPAPLPMSNIFC